MSGRRIGHLVVAAVIVANLSGSAHALERYRAMWALGDSLSDDGNLWNDCTGRTEPPVALGYDRGRYSDGPVWVERLAEIIGLDPDDDNDFTDLAFGGAYTNLYNRNISPFDQEPATCRGETGMLAQAAEASVSSLESRDLVTLLAGANDYFAWLQADEPSVQADMSCVGQGLGPLDGNGAPSSANIARCAALVVGDIAKGIAELHDGGARNFIIGNLPHLGNTPEGRKQGPQAAELLNEIVEAHNRTLAAAIGILGETYRDARFTLLDLSALFDAFLAKPGRFGLTNITVPCLTPGITGQRIPTKVCADGQSGRTLFWDPIHPTRRIHDLTAVYAATTMAADRILPKGLKHRQARINARALWVTGIYATYGRIFLRMAPHQLISLLAMRAR
ncbi:MAG: SGNH/GDSL hydrolase family protein [Geminicoccaceae bacterium]|nr:SGNH/GDSL hydrolase family protein [Geminicoccaceae bacterium]